MRKVVTTEEFIIKAKSIHGNKYDYSKVNYLNVRTKVKIICYKHGEFNQTPNKHLKNSGCPKCGFISRCNKVRSNTKEFIEKTKNIHGNKYDYSKVNYVGKENKVIIICSKHGEFNQTPHNHLSGNGCPICRESKGEIKIREFLIKNNISFIAQKRFNDCRYILPLPFDFYLPKHNICIEYQGIQHYKPRCKFGGEKEFKKIKIKDLIKLNYCEEKKINLITINYKENVNEILSRFF